VNRLLLLDEPKPSVFDIDNILDMREAYHWQDRNSKHVYGIVEHIGVAPTFKSLTNYLKGNNDRSVSATFVIGGDYIGQIALLVGSGESYSLLAEKFARAANHAGIQSFPNRNPKPDWGNPNWWTIGKEHVGYPGQIWTEEMVQNDILCNQFITLCLESTPFTYTLSHADFDPINRKNCPGPTFPWGRVYGRQLFALDARLTMSMQNIPTEKLHQLEIGDFDGYEKVLKEYM
jgi:N-acetyl-anhydromuramyl-L-alanine amidase AmpD